MDKEGPKVEGGGCDTGILAFSSSLLPPDLNKGSSNQWKATQQPFANQQSQYAHQTSLIGSIQQLESTVPLYTNPTSQKFSSKLKSHSSLLQHPELGGNYIPNSSVSTDLQCRQKLRLLAEFRSKQTINVNALPGVTPIVESEKHLEPNSWCITSSHLHRPVTPLDASPNQLIGYPPVLLHAPPPPPPPPPPEACTKLGGNLAENTHVNPLRKSPVQHVGNKRGSNSLFIAQGTKLHKKTKSLNNMKLMNGSTENVDTLIRCHSQISKAENEHSLGSHGETLNGDLLAGSSLPWTHYAHGVYSQGHHFSGLSFFSDNAQPWKDDSFISNYFTTNNDTLKANFTLEAAKKITHNDITDKHKKQLAFLSKESSTFDDKPSSRDSISCSNSKHQNHKLERAHSESSLISKVNHTNFSTSMEEGMSDVSKVDISADLNKKVAQVISNLHLPHVLGSEQGTQHFKTEKSNAGKVKKKNHSNDASKNKKCKKDNLHAAIITNADLKKISFQQSPCDNDYQIHPDSDTKAPTTEVDLTLKSVLCSSTSLSLPSYCFNETAGNNSSGYNCNTRTEIHEDSHKDSSIDSNLKQSFPLHNSKSITGPMHKKREYSDIEVKAENKICNSDSKGEKTETKSYLLPVPACCENCQKHGVNFSENCQNHFRNLFSLNHQTTSFSSTEQNSLNFLNTLPKEQSHVSCASHMSQDLHCKNKSNYEISKSSSESAFHSNSSFGKGISIPQKPTLKPLWQPFTDKENEKPQRDSKSETKDISLTQPAKITACCNSHLQNLEKIQSATSEFEKLHQLSFTHNYLSNTSYSYPCSTLLNSTKSPDNHYLKYQMVNETPEVFLAGPITSSNRKPTQTSIAESNVQNNVHSSTVVATSSKAVKQSSVNQRANSKIFKRINIKKEINGFHAKTLSANAKASKHPEKFESASIMRTTSDSYSEDNISPENLLKDSNLLTPEMFDKKINFGESHNSANAHKKKSEKDLFHDPKVIYEKKLPKNLKEIKSEEPNPVSSKDDLDYRLRTNAKIEIPNCGCLGPDYIPSETMEGPFYTHLGTAPNLKVMREIMEKRTGYTGDAIRFEKIVFTGKEGKSSQGCPIAKWIIRRSGPDEKLLYLVRQRLGHYCPSALIVVCMVSWDGVSNEIADDMYDYLVPTLTQFGMETDRRCATNEKKTCACQGLDLKKRGASFSFGCSWSMYFNGCKFARSREARKFKLRDTSLEEVMEDKFQNLASEVGPLYHKIAPDSYKNQVHFENDGFECRLGRQSDGDNPCRPFSGVTACVDFCAHAHKDLHNMNNGSTVVVTLTKHRGFEKPRNEQLHVLPLYILDMTDEKNCAKGQIEKVQSGAIEILHKYPMEARIRAQPLTPKRKGKSSKKESPVCKNDSASTMGNSTKSVQQDVPDPDLKKENSSFLQSQNSSQSLPAWTSKVQTMSSSVSGFSLVDKMNSFNNERKTLFSSDMTKMNNNINSGKDSPSVSHFSKMYNEFWNYFYTHGTFPPANFLDTWPPPNTGLGYNSSKTPVMQPYKKLNCLQTSGVQKSKVQKTCSGKAEDDQTPQRKANISVNKKARIYDETKMSLSLSDLPAKFRSHEEPLDLSQRGFDNLLTQKQTLESRVRPASACNFQNEAVSEVKRPFTVASLTADDFESPLHLLSEAVMLRSNENSAVSEKSSSDDLSSVKSKTFNFQNFQNFPHGFLLPNSSLPIDLTQQPHSNFSNPICSFEGKNIFDNVCKKSCQNNSTAFSLPVSKNGKYQTNSDIPISVDSESRVDCPDGCMRDPHLVSCEMEYNEESFADSEIGGVAIALSHGSVLFEVAKRELHATTAVFDPNRYSPTRISLVFYQHKNMNLRHHGWYENEEKLEMLRQKRLQKMQAETADQNLSFISENDTKASGKKRRKKDPEMEIPTPLGQYKYMWEAPARHATTLTTDSVITQWIDPQPTVTGPYQRWI